MQNDERPAGKFLPTGYRPKDYERVDANFGDVATLRSLVNAAHRRGMRVILDMPITLPGFEHPFLADPSKKDWFGPPTEYGVPRWKVENPEVADYLIGVSKRWKERSGCDGFRIDSAHLQPVAFWKRFVAELKSAPPRRAFVILPELTINPREIGKFVTEAGFDGAYDFSVLRVREVLGKGEDVGLLSFIAREAKQYYPSPPSMLAPIDNYEDAFASIAKEPKAVRTRLALTYLLTLDRVPLLYAGNELGIAFRDVGGAFPGDRREFPLPEGGEGPHRPAETRARRSDGAISPRSSPATRSMRSCGHRARTASSSSSTARNGARIRDADRRSKLEGLPTGGPDRRRGHQVDRWRGGDQPGAIRQEDIAGEVKRETRDGRGWPTRLTQHAS